MAELGAWDSFYVIVGSAAGALIGLQFVVMTLVAARPLPHKWPRLAPRLPRRRSFISAPRCFCRHWYRFHGNPSFPPRFFGALSACAEQGTRWSWRGGCGGKMFINRSRGLAMSCDTAAGGVRDTRDLGLRDSVPHARGPVRCRRRGAAVAFHRYPQRLGQHLVPRVLQRTRYKGMSDADRNMSQLHAMAGTAARPTDDYSPFASSQRSASIAAMHPVPAAVTACR